MISFAGQSFPLFKGTTTYSFSFSLNPNLPSSFTGDSGKIKYKMEFVLDKPWKFNEKHTIALNIIQTMDLNSSPDASKAFEQQLTKSIGFIDSGPISLHVVLPKTGYAFDEVIPVQVYFENLLLIPIGHRNLTLKCTFNLFEGYRIESQ